MEDCGEENFLVVHHIKPLWELIRDYSIETLDDAKCDERLFDTNNGITLCDDCHNYIKDFEHEYADEFMKIVSNK